MEMPKYIGLVRKEVDMTQTLIPPTGDRLVAPRPVLSLHGSADGIPMTWHVTLIGEHYLIERAEGDIHSPAVWMQARRDASVVDEVEVLELVRKVFTGPAR